MAAWDFGEIGDYLYTDEGPSRYFGLLGRVGRVLATASRYIAYASEVGEAVRPLVSPRIVGGLYGIAYAYVAVDVSIKSHGEFQKTDGDMNLVARKGLETFIFQSLASIVVPSVVIHTVVHLVNKKTSKSSSRLVARYAPTLAGLSVIPFLPFLLDEPLDHLVGIAFDDHWPLPVHNNGGTSDSGPTVGQKCLAK